MQRRPFEYPDHLQEAVAYDPEEIERTRKLAPGEQVRTEDEPVHEAVADEPYPSRRIALRWRTDDLLQAWGQLPGAVEDEGIFQRGKPVRVPHRLADDALHLRGAVEVELAPDEIIEDRRSVPVLVDEVHRDG